MAAFNPIISLTTDFGLSDGYVGILEGVILSICPSAKITHLSHLIPPQDIYAAAFVLYQSFRYYPNYTVHCVVVDPGVGSSRRAVAVRSKLGIFVGPDNGVLSLVLAKAEVQEAVSLTNPIYQLKSVSSTFHGRDIFSPAAAHLAAGAPLEVLGEPVTDLTRFDFRTGLKAGQSRVIHIDHFGNLVLDATAQDIPNPAKLTVTTVGRTITSLSRTFTDVAEGEPLIYIGSTHDHLEIAVRNGNAAQTLGLQRGNVVQIDIK
jgi:hypothetical protein